MAETMAYRDRADLESMLAPFLRSSAPRYRTARWLKCDFFAEVWRIVSDTEFELDWRVRLQDGSLLTERQHADLLEALRSWLIARFHVDVTGGRLYSVKSERNAIQRVVHCIDYLLLRAQPLGLLVHGLAAVSPNDLKAMIAQFASSGSVHSSVYEWPSRLSRYLRQRIAELGPGALAGASRHYPDLCTAVPRSNRLTDLDDDEVVLARAWLALSNLYKEGHNYRLSPKTKPLTDDLYAGTIFGRSTIFPLPPELCLGPNHRIDTEYPRAEVKRSGGTRTSTKNLLSYVDALSPLALLSAEGLAAPTVSVEELKRSAAAVQTESAGRFRTVPQHVLFTSLRKAVELLLAFGDALVDSYLAVTRAAIDAGLSVPLLAEQRSIEDCLTDECKRLGVRTWTIEYGGNTLPAAVWYSDLRSNRGLYESLRVLFGAIQVILGTLSARRRGELTALMSGTALDASMTRIVFRNCKSGFGGFREVEARPIPTIAVRAVKLLERMQSALIQMGALSSHTALLAPPRLAGSVGLVSLSASHYCESLDYYCDWAELPLDNKGARYYLRQHQLRRFFCMLFFWGGGFGGVDTLRWFLGHTEVRHLWHYITEAMPGVAIRSVAAEWAAYAVKHSTREAELLNEELSEHFGTMDFSVLDAESLQLHLEDLLEEGRLTIEPQFLDGDRHYRIAIILRPKEVQ
jgi:hypothetical protein